jgi:hypothetical protein
MTALIAILQILGLLLIALIVVGFAARMSLGARSAHSRKKSDEYARHAPTNSPEHDSDHAKPDR